MSGWMTIDSAPFPEKIGGTAVFLVWNGQEIWATKAFKHYDHTVTMECHGCAGWAYEDEFKDPTHWHPMPDPPE